MRCMGEAFLRKNVTQEPAPITLCESPSNLQPGLVYRSEFDDQAKEITDKLLAMGGGLNSFAFRPYPDMDSHS